jgi:ketosteroid isomerase-like protein
MRSCWFLLVVGPFVVRAQDTTAVKASLLAADRLASTRETALRSALAPTATVLLPNLDILRGRPAYAVPVAAMTKGAAGRPVGRAAWTPVHAIVSHDGSFGCTTGVLHFVASDSTQPTTGRYAACWQRAGRGAWQMIAWSSVAARARVTSLPDSIPGAPGSSGAAVSRGVHAAHAMSEADRAFARYSTDSGGPGGAFARWIALDGMMLGARAVPVRGSEQARAAFAGFPPSGLFAWGPIDTLTVASRDGSLGFTIGEARIAASPDEVSYSKYLTIWRHEADGAYRFVFDIGSDRPAPQAK